MAETQPVQPSRAPNDTSVPRSDSLDSWDPWASVPLAEPAADSASLQLPGRDVPSTPLPSTPPSSTPSAAPAAFQVVPEDPAALLAALQGQIPESPVFVAGAAHRRAPLPPPPLVPPLSSQALGPSRKDRQHPRRQLPIDTPARITLPGGRRHLFVNLLNISYGGCCIVRKGDLDLKAGDSVKVAIWRGTIDSKVTLSARVCWLAATETASWARMRFVDGSQRLHRQIDDYTDRHTPGSVEAWYKASHGRSAPEPVTLAPATVPGVATATATTAAVSPAVGGATEAAAAAGAFSSGARRTADSGAEPRAGGSEADSNPHTWNDTDKLALLVKIIGISEIEQVQLFHRLGISPEQVERWRQEATDAHQQPMLILQAQGELALLLQRDQRLIQCLRDDLQRLEKDVAITEELLQVARRLQSLSNTNRQPEPPSL